jgi:hypothetical protein
MNIYIPLTVFPVVAFFMYLHLQQTWTSENKDDPKRAFQWLFVWVVTIASILSLLGHLYRGF